MQSKPNVCNHHMNISVISEGFSIVFYISISLMEKSEKGQTKMMTPAAMPSIIPN